MKRIITVLILSLVIFSSAGAFARQDFEVTGGLIYTTFDFEDLNNNIKEINNFFRELAGSEAEMLDYMEEIESGMGFYVGAMTEVSPQFKLGVEYEDISPKEITLSGSAGTNKVDFLEVDLKLKALVGVAEYQLNDLFSLKGGLGYYFGEESINSFTLPKSINTDLNGFGIKGGVAFDYPVQHNLKLTASANYRLLTLEGDQNLTLSHLLDENLTAKDKELNANGLELQAGLTYLF